ncbi:MAG: PH domain-containing protein [Chloroflexi bacterium]|nr:PH domain-containing protein [Chloroflexota bacterium]
MAYIDTLLSRGEQVRYVARRHVLVLIGNILPEVVMILALVGVAVAAGTALPEAAGGEFGVRNVVLIGCLAVSAVLLARAALDFVRWNTELFVVTTARVIITRGIIGKEVLDSSLEKINDIELRQSAFGRMFDYGDIEVLTGAEAGVNLLPRIARPIEFKRAMLEAKQDMARDLRGGPVGEVAS